MPPSKSAKTQSWQTAPSLLVEASAALSPQRVTSPAFTACARLCHVQSTRCLPGRSRYQTAHGTVLSGWPPNSRRDGKLTPLVEPLSIDEAFLDLSGTQKLHGATPAELLVQFVTKIQTELRLSVSVGLAPNKFLAKIASDLDKPRGFSVIGDAEKKEFLAKQPTSVIWGVGKVFQAKLERDGIKTIGQLQLKDPTDLARKYGAMGLRLAKLCQGEDDRHVSSNRGAKSISGETTFNTDVSDVTQLSKSLWALTEKVSYRTKKAEKSGRSVTLKLKTADFKTITRSRMLHDPTQLADKIFRTADDLLHNVADGKMRFRLIGVGIGDLGPADQADPEDLLDEQAEKRAKAERAMDALRGKFKDSSVVSLGRSIKAPGKR